MNKIILNNFPRQAQTATMQKINDKGAVVDVVEVISSFGQPGSRNQIISRLSSDILMALLVHETLSIPIYNVQDFVQTFGFDDTVKLLRSGCLEILDDNALNPVLKKYPDRCEPMVFVNLDNSFDELEKRMQEHHPSDKKKISILMTEVEAHVNKIQRLDQIENTILSEVDYDLRNQNLTDFMQIISNSRTAINYSDTYKILRLLDINKCFAYADEIKADSLLLDGGAQAILSAKLSPLLRQGNPSDSLEIFRKILQDKKLPDLSQLYLKSIIQMDEILELRENVSGRKFRDWLHDIDYEPSLAYEKLLNKKPGSASTGLAKIMRFTVPKVVGILNLAAGIGVSFFESFVLDRILKGWHPNLFLDDVLKHSIDEKIKSHAETQRKDIIAKRFPRVDRNDPCPCGSKKRFRRCCGKQIR